MSAASLEEHEIKDAILKRVKLSDIGDVELFKKHNPGQLSIDQFLLFLAKVKDDGYILKNRSGEWEITASGKAFKGYKDLFLRKSHWLYRVNEMMQTWKTMWTICISIIALGISVASLVFNENSDLKDEIKFLKAKVESQDNKIADQDKKIDSLIDVSWRPSESISPDSVKNSPRITPKSE